MNKIPFFHSYDPLSKKLTLKNANYLPEEVFEFSEQIEILDASHGTLFKLPDNFPKLLKLKIAFFSNNYFTEIPAVLANCSQLKVAGFKSCKVSNLPENALPLNLRWLILTDNRLQKLPCSIGKLKNLQKLALTGNRLEELPEQLNNCQNLELLRLSANSLTREPSFLFEMPRLAWYADSGNLWQAPHPQLVDLPQVGYDQIKFIRLLGESPSSEVWESEVDGFAQPLAVKKYKGKMTSDGYIEDDLQSCILASNHKNIITVRGRIKTNTGEGEGLIMNLIPADYTSLGQPPSLESCTRDTFPSNSQFSSEFICEILKSIAAAMANLHLKGLSHGDLYAHNILSNRNGQCFLGDFGAASRYDPLRSKQREHIESRAFGYLMDDLLQRCSSVPPTELHQLQKQCLSPEVKARPLMMEIFESL